MNTDPCFDILLYCRATLASGHSTHFTAAHLHTSCVGGSARGVVLLGATERLPGPVTLKLFDVRSRARYVLVIQCTIYPVICFGHGKGYFRCCIMLNESLYFAVHAMVQEHANLSQHFCRERQVSDQASDSREEWQKRRLTAEDNDTEEASDRRGK